MAEPKEQEPAAQAQDDGYDTTTSTLPVPDTIPEKPDMSGSDHNSELGEKKDVEATEAKPTEQTEQPLQRNLTGLRFFLVMASILSSAFLFSLDNTVVADVQGLVVEHFDAIDRLPWLANGFALGAVSTTLVWGKIYSQFDAKWLYIFNVLLFELGSTLCGAAPNISCLIVGRALAGIGGMGMYIGVMTLIAYTTTIQERSIYVGLTGLTWGLGTVLGPVIGGAFSDSAATWRWAFYINLCVGGVFAPVYVFLIPSADPRPGEKVSSRVVHIDFVGAILQIGAIVALVMAFCFGGILYPWNSGRIIALWVVSGVLFILLGIQQVWTIFTNEQDRIFPVEFFTHKYAKELLVLFCSISCAATVAFTPLYMIPLYFQFTRADSALEAGVRLLPLIITMVFLCILNGAVMSATGYYQPWYVFGGALGVTGGALMFTLVDQTTPASKIYGFSVLLGIGSGAFIQAGFSVAQAIVEPHNVPNAVGFISLGQCAGFTIAVAVVNNVLINGAQRRLSDLLPGLTTAEVQATIAGFSSTIFNGLSDDKKSQVLDAIVTSISDTYGTVIAAGAFALVLSLFMSRKRIFLKEGAAS